MIPVDASNNDNKFILIWHIKKHTSLCASGLEKVLFGITFDILCVTLDNIFNINISLSIHKKSKVNLITFIYALVILYNFSLPTWLRPVGEDCMLQSVENLQQPHINS